MHRRTACPLSAASLLWLTALCLMAPPLAAAPDAVLWPRWLAHDEASRAQIDHSVWDRFLAAYLDDRHPSGIHRMAYAAVSIEDKLKLEGYVRHLQRQPVSRLGRAEQKAFWINLYNAATVLLVLDHYPVTTILKIRLGGLLRSGPWDGQILKMEAEKLSLNDVEHRILRPIWGDNRIHYALNCASLGCPNLQPSAFSAENSEPLLEKASRSYINHPRGVRFDGERLKISSIYKWYAVDFGGSRRALLDHLALYAAPSLAARLRTHGNRIGYAYDWDLNE
jgi:hypothetical protein